MYHLLSVLSTQRIYLFRAILGINSRNLYKQNLPFKKPGGYYMYHLLQHTKKLCIGRAIAQAVSRRFPTAAARFETWLSHMGFVVDRVTLGQVFSEYFGFPCHLSFH
jgi:hypothetical protein